MSSPKDKSKRSRWQLNASSLARASYDNQAARRRQLSSGPLASENYEGQNEQDYFPRHQHFSSL
jgi:hypothetical protein